MEIPAVRLKGLTIDSSLVCIYSKGLSLSHAYFVFKPMTSALHSSEKESWQSNLITATLMHLEFPHKAHPTLFLSHTGKREAKEHGDIAQYFYYNNNHIYKAWVLVLREHKARFISDSIRLSFWFRAGGRALGFSLYSWMSNCRLGLVDSNISSYSWPICSFWKSWNLSSGREVPSWLLGARRPDASRTWVWRVSL